MLTERYITLWRKAGEQCLDWDHHVSFELEDAKRVVESLKKQGVWQYSTASLGDDIPELSSDRKELPDAR